jgi:YD repeat-containing protein
VASGGRPSKRIDQRNITTVYTYDNLGNLLQKQNAQTNPTIVEKYTYDPLGQYHPTPQNQTNPF